MKRAFSRLLVGLGIALISSACGSGGAGPSAVPSVAVATPIASVATAPTPKPTVTATATPTPAPTPAPTPTPTPEPTPTPTPAPAPTMTADDVKIEFVVKSGVAKMIELSGQMDSAATLDDVVRIMDEMRAQADAEVLMTGVFTASPCTKKAWALYEQGMSEMSSGASAVLAWVYDGAVGDMPADDVSASAATLGRALAALEASTCASSP
jgi:hypothetical protein